MLRRGSRSGAEVLRSENDKEEAFEANGEIAILKLAQDSKNPARDLADRAEQLVMVAGACNHRELTLPPVSI